MRRLHGLQRRLVHRYGVRNESVKCYRIGESDAGDIEEHEESACEQQLKDRQSEEKGYEATGVHKAQLAGPRRQ